MGSEVEEIARKLTGDEQEAVRRRGGRPEVVASPSVEPLWYAYTKHSRDDFGIALTPLGEAVRNHLIGSATHG